MLSKAIKHIFAAVSGIFVLIIYIMTLHPGVGFIDCGELAAVCYTFGVPHPTGYPVFLIIGYVISHLPMPGSVVYRLNLLSAIESSAAVVITFYAAVILLQNVIPLYLKMKINTTGKKENQSDFNLKSINVFIIASFAAMIAGLTKTWWFNATQIEVYALHSLFISIIFLISLRIIFNLNKLSRKNWALLFLFFGLSTANHSTTIYFIPGLIYLYYIQYKVNKSFAKSVLKYLLLILPSVMLYMILIFIASSQPYLNWSNPQTLDGFISHIRGSDFNHLMFSSTVNFSKNAERFFISIPGEMAILPGLFGLIGFGMVWKINKNLFVYVILLILTCLLYSYNYSSIEIQSFYLIVYYILAFFASLGTVYLLLIIDNKKFLLSDKINPVVILVGAVLIAFNLGVNYKENDNSRNYVNDDIATNTLNLLEYNSILLTYDYAFVYSASIYYQQVEKLRPDIKVFNVKFLSAPWYLETIKKYYPDVYVNIQTEADEYIKTYNVGDKNHSDRLTSFVKVFFNKIIVKFPLYLTFDCLLSKEMSIFLSSYDTEPDGLIYRLKEKGAVYNPDAGKLSLNSVFRKYEPIGFHKNKMYVSTPGVYYETAYYHFKNINYNTSLKFLEKALELNGNFKDAVTLKNQIIKETRKK